MTTIGVLLFIIGFSLARATEPQRLRVETDWHPFFIFVYLTGGVLLLVDFAMWAWRALP